MNTQHDTSNWRARFEQDGYAIIPQILDPAVHLDPLVREFTQIIDNLRAANLPFAQYKELGSSASFDARIKQLLSNSGQLFIQDLNISCPAKPGLPADTPIALLESVYRLLTSAEVLDLVSCIVGDEIVANPIQHARVKPPEARIAAAPIVSPHASDALHQGLGITANNALRKRTPWHQDAAVVTPDADTTELVTVWVPVTDASEENGCLQVLPGSHHVGLRVHCPGETSDLTAAQAQIAGTAKRLPALRGDIIVLHRHLLHASLPNHSDTVRMSLDFRYQPCGQPSGRALLPAFVVRSSNDPSSVVKSVEQWRTQWLRAREVLSAGQLKPLAPRWSALDEMCA
jgi:phytanoyl-CoA hydroxylase